MVRFPFSSSRKGNPQSGAEESVTSSSAPSGGSRESSDVFAPVVDLTEQRLQDWRAGGVAVGSGGVVGNNATNNNNNGMGGGNNDGNDNDGVGYPIPANNNNRRSPTTRSSPHASSTPNQLILLIERGQWAQATQRALSHEHEVKQLVKLRKTTKNNASSPSSAMGADGSEEKSGGAGGGASGGKRHLQISNVKCKALHHACQKLRSVHTSIYQKTVPVDCDTSNPYNMDNNTNNNNNNNNNTTRRFIEEDEYIEACKLILTLIRIHPEACKERESRHGCHPLHLCVFSMCATPPPPAHSVYEKGKKKSSSSEGHQRTNSGGPLSSAGGAGGKPPMISNRSTSTGDLKRPPTTPSNNNNNPLNIPKKQSHHQKTPSGSSTDFSLGGFSAMVMEESEHISALENHRSSSTKKIDGNSLEEQIIMNQNEMERLLIDWEDKHDKKQQQQSTSTKGGDTHNDELKEASRMTPMDGIEERSRETDSHSTPQDNNSPKNNGKVGVASRTDSPTSFFPPSPSAVASARQQRPKTPPASPSTKYSPDDYCNPLSPSAQPTYEELQRRYLQINTKRRDEYSVRVINALLDSWPKSIKTPSEGERLPLHMACFGKATVKVMETILKAYADAARQRNHDGFLPIHIAAHWGVSHPDIAPLILRAYPDGAVGRNRWERTPIEEALGMAGENGRPHQLSLVWSLRRHPTYWIHNDIGSMLSPQNVRFAPWRMVDVGDIPSENGNGVGGVANGNLNGRTGERKMLGGGGAVDVDTVGSSDDDEEGVEVQVAHDSSTTPQNDPAYIRALAQNTELSLLITKDKHWGASALRCRAHPEEACEAMEVKVRGAYTAKITPLHYACEHQPSVEVIRALIKANPHALERRQEPGGQLPLHAACTWGASPDVVRTLLTRPSCAEMKDFLSNLPLHCACYSGASTTVIEILLKVYPQSVWPRNHQGSSAVDIVRRLTHPNRRQVLGMLERTMSRLLERAAGAAEQGVEMSDKSLEWV